MSEAILKALMQLFALLAAINGDRITGGAREVVGAFLRRYLNKELTARFLDLFESYLAEVTGKSEHLDETGRRKRTSSHSVKVLGICNRINEELHRREKLLVLARIIEFANHNLEINEQEADLIATLSDVFSIPQDESAALKQFIAARPSVLTESEFWLRASKDAEGLHHLRISQINGVFVVFFSRYTDILLLKYEGSDELELGPALVDQDRFHVMDKGAIIHGSRMTPVYYSTIMDVFMQKSDDERLFLDVEDLCFRFPRSDNGIHQFNLHEEAGHMVGIMGGSGVGKSTLMALLTGSLKPESGSISVNGHALQGHKQDIRRFIGLVPQDDLLVEELSVFQNLFFNAQLCFKSLSREEIIERTHKVLNDLGLGEIANLKVGSPLNKYISGGQRKRLNIALELIREPKILFVDEPTSGLSSNDSDHVMHLLKELALKGQLVLVNIHQPSSEIFKLFDRLIVLDKGGFTAYNGNPLEALPYLKRIVQYAHSGSSECETCGNVNPEQILEIVEARMVDAAGKYTSERKVSPSEWHQYFAESNVQNQHKPDERKLPALSFMRPGSWKQFRIFFKRNFLSKLSNRQYVLLNLLEAPALAFILAFFTRYSSDESYRFANNSNFPAFLLMCIIVPLFMGMSVSAEDIIRDRKILQREKFLQLSRMSYLMSKITFLILLSAFQTFTFVLIANEIMGIEGMLPAYWVTLFGVSVFSNMVGLNISSGLNSVVTIYILIPLIIVPQLMLSGGIIRFDRLNPDITHNEYVPLAGDVMASRWAYEALAVYQFRENDYIKPVFGAEQKRSNAGYYSAFFIPEVRKCIDASMNNNDAANENVVIQHAIEELVQREHMKPFPIEFSEDKPLDALTAAALQSWLDECDEAFLLQYRKATKERDSIFAQMELQYGSEGLLTLKNAEHNEALSDMVLNRNSTEKVIRDGDHLVRRKDPVFQLPGSVSGRAHFFAPEKRLGNLSIDTFVFNNLVLWLMSLVLFVTLYTDLLRRVIGFREKRIKS